MNKTTNKMATDVSRGQNNLINGITIKEDIMGIDVRLGLTKVDYDKDVNFGYGWE